MYEVKMLNEKYSKDYSSQEMMVVAAAREIEDGDVIFVGIGLPVLASLLAQRTHAPNLIQIYEAGVIGARPARLALSIGDPALVSGSQMVVDFSAIFNNFLQIFSFLGA
jgi:glutaconate CoA-transferase subunit B